jgi:DNA-binding transcriptional ArsR family regulator
MSMVKTSPGYEANRARISLALSEFTVPLLSRIYHAFDGDVVGAIVLGEIAHRNVEEWLARYENSAELLDDPARRETLMRPCNALSIAESCGLPRETVRRKVVTLTERGYIYRSEEGFLFLTRTVGDDFEDMTAKLVEELLATARRLESLLANQPTPLGSLRLD